MTVAAGGSASIPGAFPPRKYVDGYNMTEYLIDGGVIGNDPSLIAWSLKRFGDNSTHDKSFRILSLGAGRSKRETIIDEPDDFNTLSSWTNAIIDLSSTTPVELANFYLKSDFKRRDKEDDYVRA